MSDSDSDSDAAADEKGEYLAGQLLVAMPGMTDPRFHKTVIYMCAHNADGAMGLVINRALESFSFPDMLKQLEIDVSGMGERINLHSPDYLQEATMVVDQDMALTATVDILKAIAFGTGPRQSLLALGYAGWGPGQLDTEIMSNGWLSVDADNDLVFGPNLDEKWDQAMGKIGIDPRMLSGEAGHA